MIDRTNRVLLTLLSVVLIAAGAASLVAAIGAARLVAPAALYEQLVTWVRADPWVWWLAIMVGLLLILLLALRWVLRQFIVRRRGTGLATLVLDAGSRGTTTVEAASVARVAAADLERLRPVTGTTARLVDSGRERMLRTRMDVEADADLQSLRERADEVYDRIGDLLGIDALLAHTRIRLVAGAQRRVT